MTEVNKDDSKKAAQEVSIKVLAAALKDRVTLERLCKNFQPEGFPKSIRDFAKIVWDVCHTKRAKLTQDVLDDYLKTHSKSSDATINCQKTFTSCQAALGKVQADEFPYFFEKLTTYRADRIIREALQGVDEDNQAILEKGKAVKGVVELLSADKDPYAAATQLKHALSKVEALSKEDPVIRVTVKERSKDKLKEYEAIKSDKSLALGLLTGFGPLDDVTRGLQPGEMLLFGGRPGTGKSQCLVNIATTMYKAGRNVLLFSLEMPFRQYEDRFISCYAGLDNERMSMGALNEVEEQTLKKAWEDVGNTKNEFEIIDFPKVDGFQLESEIHRALDKYQPDVMIIDYIGIMKPNDKSSTADWEAQGKIAEEVRQIGRMNRLPIVSAVQLNRSKTKEASTDRLSRSDIIGATADVIVMLNDKDPKEDQLSEMMKLTVIKNRKGQGDFEFDMYKNFRTITIKDPSTFRSRLAEMRGVA